jgi:hypothetical protein
LKISARISSENKYLYCIFSVLLPDNENIKPILFMTTCRFLFSAVLSFVFTTTVSYAQKCESWSDPVALSDSLEDNHNPFVVHISNDYATYYVFWDRSLDVFGSEIVCTDFYNSGETESVVLAEGYNVSSPQVISMVDWYPVTDTLAFIFYESSQNSSKDLYYTVMTGNGFSEPIPFASTPRDETHLRVSPGGGIVWQEGDAIRYCRLRPDNSGYYFDPVVTIDEGECYNPDIQKTMNMYDMDQRIVWEKGNPDQSQVWYSEWDYANEAWSNPVRLFDDIQHKNVYFPGGMKEFGGWNQILVSEYVGTSGNYFISAHEFYTGEDFISEFSQPVSFQSDLFTYDVLTDDYLGAGYFAFRYYTGQGNSDIYSTDLGWTSPALDNYCMIDSTSTSENNPRLFEGKFYSYAFDLICIWESWRNGHSQLYTAKTLVLTGDVTENTGKGAMNIRAVPDPFSGSFTLEFNADKAAPVTIKIFDFCGQPVMAMNRIHSLPGKNSIRIDAHELASGIYILGVESERGTGQIKLIKK